MPSTALTPFPRHASASVILVAQPQSASKLKESKHIPASGVIASGQHDNKKLVTRPSTEDRGEDNFPHPHSDIQDNAKIFDLEC